MNNIISLSHQIYTKDAIYSSIKEWKEYLKINILSQNQETYNLEIQGNDIKKIQEFLNYILDKSSIEEIVK